MISEIGSKVKKLRTDKQMTLKNLSELTNLSIGYLSQLERGKTTAALDSLQKIAEVLGVDFSYFFEITNTNSNEICKRFEHHLLFMERDNYIEYQLSHKLDDKVLLPRLVEVLPQKASEPIQLYKHNGEEFLYILEGILTFYLNRKAVDLYPGDSLHIHSSMPHNLANNTNSVVRFIVVSVPNKFDKERKPANPE